jgi:serine/threonine protein kinase
MNLLDEIWAELTKLGFSEAGQTLSLLHSWLRRIRLTHTLPVVSVTKTGFRKKHVHFSGLVFAMKGKFGQAYCADRTEGELSHVCFIKTSPDYPQGLLLEGILQSIAHTVLRVYGFPKAVPKVLDMFQHPTQGVGLSLERQMGAKLFADWLEHGLQWGVPSPSNDRLLCEVLAQIATYMAILEHAIGMNHRDLKGTNVLMIAANQPVHQTVTCGKTNWTIHTQNQAIMIDFGFACIGQSDGTHVVSAGEYLPTLDFCPKEGRDCFLFLASLWNVEQFRKSVTPALAQLFHKWLQTNGETKWSDWLQTYTPTNMESMYLLTSASHFKSEPSSPMNILRDVAKIHPSIVEFQ